MNCIIVDDEEMSRNAMAHLVGHFPFFNLVKACAGSIEALNVLNEEKIDLVFLDIKMPEMDGLELIKSLSNPPLIILVTSKEEYAIEAFEYNVVDYILKPVAVDRFFRALTRARELYEIAQRKEISRYSDCAFVKTDAGWIRINTNDILWIEALGDYVTVHTQNKRHTIHSTMKAVEKKLPSDTFIRVHRSFIVSVHNIKSIDDTVIVTDKKLIPVGAFYKGNLMKRLNLL